MDGPRRARIAATAGWYALAFWLTTLAHEAAHFVAGWATDRGPTMHATFVEYARTGSVTAELATALAGPLTSGLSGAILLGALRARHVPTPARPLVAWLAYHGLVNLVGYVFSVAFAPGADLGHAAALLGAPTWLRIATTVAGLCLLRLVARPFGEVFAADSAEELSTDDEAKLFAGREVLLPAWLATPVLMLVSMPVPHWLTWVYTMTAALPLFDLPDAVVRARTTPRTSVTRLRPAVPIVLFALVVAASRWTLDVR